MPIPIEVILGSGGLAVFAVWIVTELWKSHKAADQRERDRADALEKRLADVVDILKRAKPR